MPTAMAETPLGCLGLAETPLGCLGLAKTPLGCFELAETPFEVFWLFPLYILRPDSDLSDSGCVGCATKSLTRSGDWIICRVVEA